MPASAIQFSFSGGDLSGLADSAIELGFTVAPTEDGDGLIVTTTEIVDELRFPDFDDLAHGWASEFGAEYMGWEAGPPG